jgi:hypothetical protein
MTYKFWSFALLSVYFCGAVANCQSYCPSYFPQPPGWLQTQVTNMVGYLTSVPSPFADGVTYTVETGSISFPGLPASPPASRCTSGGENSPNPSSCYGVYQIPTRSGNPGNGTYYALDPDEALLFIGVAPPGTSNVATTDTYYYGFQTYVYDRYDTVTGSYPTAPTPYASFGPAINQRNANGVAPAQPETALRTSPTDYNQIFGEQLAVISSPNSQTAGDVSIALSHLWSTPNQTYANNLTNIEVLPVRPGSNNTPPYGFIQLGSLFANPDELQTVLRLTPEKDSNGNFESADYSYMQYPPACVLRISPASANTTVGSNNYTNTQSVIPNPTTASEGTVWQNNVPAGALSLASELAYVQQQVIDYWTTPVSMGGPGLTQQNIPGQGSPIWPTGSTNLGWTFTDALIHNSDGNDYVPTEGRYCIEIFWYNESISSATTPSCKGDSPDADYFAPFISPTTPPINLSGTAVVVLVGVNHEALGSATYSNVALQTAGVAVALDFNQLTDSAKAWEASDIAGATEPVPSYLFVATFTSPANCGTLVGCQSISLPLNGAVFDERSYLGPTAGTKPVYADTTPAVLLWFQ